MEAIIEGMIVAASTQFRMNHLYGGRWGIKAWSAAFTITSHPK
jgi:hypothetical protein